MWFLVMIMHIIIEIEITTYNIYIYAIYTGFIVVNLIFNKSKYWLFGSGGTIFGTTPGGTKIVYERAFLMNMRNSPLAKTPPNNMPCIPGRILIFFLS